jgi:hypothetical protein
VLGMLIRRNARRDENGRKLIRPTKRKLRMRVMRKLPVVPICRMRAALSKDPNQQHICAVPPLQEGRFAIVTSVGSGMRWTRVASQDVRLSLRRRSRVVLTSQG